MTAAVDRGRAGMSRDERHPDRWSAARAASGLQRRMSALGIITGMTADEFAAPRGAAVGSAPARRASRSGTPNRAGAGMELCDKRRAAKPSRGRRCRSPGVLAGARGTSLRARRGNAPANASPVNSAGLGPGLDDWMGARAQAQRDGDTGADHSKGRGLEGSKQAHATLDDDQPHEPARRDCFATAGGAARDDGRCRLRPSRNDWRAFEGGLLRMVVRAGRAPTDPPHTGHPSAVFTLLYVGVAPRDAVSNARLGSRLCGQHLGGNVGSSTFRFGLASLLRAGA
jgi:hypothetical protein